MTVLGECEEPSCLQRAIIAALITSTYLLGLVPLQPGGGRCTVYACCRLGSSQASGGWHGRCRHAKSVRERVSACAPAYYNRITQRTHTHYMLLDIILAVIVCFIDFII